MEQPYNDYNDPTAAEQIHLRDYLQILNKHRLTVVTVFLIVAVLALILGLGKEPLYTSSSTVLVEKNQPNSNLGSSSY